MRSKILNCGFKLIPYIYRGRVNNFLTEEEFRFCNETFDQLEKESESHRLSKNFSRKNLHLDKMFLFSILTDPESGAPVFVTGVQRVGSYSARVFSRYYVFEKFRTKPSVSSMFDKIDNFQVLQFELSEALDTYPFIFWSRDKGVSFFRRLKSKKLDIFNDWNVHNEKVEIIYPGNIQGIFYLNNGDRSSEFYIKKDLSPKDK